MEFIDTHAHLTSKELLPQLDAILERAKHAKVSRIINICTDPTTLQEGLALHQREPWVFNAGATTPHDVEREGDSCFSYFEKAAKSHQLIAIGETGLDYHYEHSNRASQQAFFIRYLQLAKECDLPVIFHCRDAFADLFAITDQEKLSHRAILHCFTGTKQEAKQALDRGWMISFSGIVTFRKSIELKETAALIPLEHLLIETDAPYLAPQSRRGQINESSFVVETAACLAELKGVSLEHLAKTTKENAERVFGKL